MNWFKKVLHFFTPLSSVELPNPLKEKRNLLELEIKKVIILLMIQVRQM